MISLRLYCVLSFLASVACVLHAIQLRKQFYPVVVHLGTSKLSVTIMGNMIFVIALMLAHMMRQIFLGSLRAAELDRLYEKIWFAVTETCLALTIFREELRFRFVFLFTVLLFVKIFHWLSAFRVEQFHTELAVSTLTHVRVVLLMGLLLVTDVFFFVWQSKTLLLEGPSFLLLFAFEYMILWSTIVTTFIKYLLYVIDMRRNGRWTNKAVYTFYLNLLSDLFQLFVYLIFFSIVLSFFGIPLHIVRDIYNAFGNFKKRIADFIRYRRVILHMNTRFPTVTAEELEHVDATCIVCREEMTHPNAKKLPCGHIFHIDCLRSWLEENTTCPTCRNPVELDTPAHRAAAPAAVPAPAPAPPAPAAAPATPAPAPSDNSEGGGGGGVEALRTPAAPAAAAFAATPASAAQEHSSARAGVLEGMTPEAAAAAAAKAAAEAHLKAMGLSMDLLNPLLSSPVPPVHDTPAPTPVTHTPLMPAPPQADHSHNPFNASGVSNTLGGAPRDAGASLASAVGSLGGAGGAGGAGAGGWQQSQSAAATSARAAVSDSAAAQYGAPASPFATPTGGAGSSWSQGASSSQDMQHMQMNMMQQMQQQMQMMQLMLQQQHIHIQQPFSWQAHAHSHSMSSPWQASPHSMHGGRASSVASVFNSESASASPSTWGGAGKVIPELAQMEPVRRMLEEQVDATTAALEELLAGSSSFDAQEQIYETKGRIEELLIPMASSQAKYINSLLQQCDPSHSASPVCSESATIKRLKLQQAQRAIENQQRQLTDLIDLCNSNLKGFDPTAPIDETTGIRRRTAAGSQI